MKKKYIKPCLRLEKFTMTQSIATGCTALHSSNVGAPKQWSKSTCGWDLGNMVIWASTTNGCENIIPAETEGLAVCYNNPAGGNTIFAS